MEDVGTDGGDRAAGEAPLPAAAVEGPAEAGLLAVVGDWLKEAFARVGGAEDLSPEERRRWQQRLVAITNTTKRDLPRAREQTRRFDRDWAERVSGDR